MFAVLGKEMMESPLILACSARHDHQAASESRPTACSQYIPKVDLIILLAHVRFSSTSQPNCNGHRRASLVTSPAKGWLDTLSCSASRLSRRTPLPSKRARRFQYSSYPILTLPQGPSPAFLPRHPFHNPVKTQHIAALSHCCPYFKLAQPNPFPVFVPQSTQSSRKCVHRRLVRA